MLSPAQFTHGPAPHAAYPLTSTYPRPPTRGRPAPFQEHLQGHPSWPTQAGTGVCTPCSALTQPVP